MNHLSALLCSVVLQLPSQPLHEPVERRLHLAVLGACTKRLPRYIDRALDSLDPIQPGVLLGDDLDLHAGNTWLDAGTIYSMDVETGSIKFGGIAGRMKVRRLTVTGKIQGAHKLRIRTTRDDQTTADDVSYTLSSGGGVRRLRVGCAFPARMAPMRVRITDEGDGVVTLASSFDISGLSLNVGVAKGLNISGAQDRK